VYNTNIHERTKYMPYELVFGRMVRISTSSTLPDDKGNESYSEYTTALFNRIFDAQDVRTSNIQKLDLSDTMIANPQVFNKDDYVYLLKEPLSGKFDE